MAFLDYRGECHVHLLILIGVSLIPALLWMWFFRAQDSCEKERPKTLLVSFVAGMLAVAPAILLEEPFRTLMETGSTAARILIAFGVVGLGEEALKLLAVYWSVYRRPEFNEVVDGMIYSIAAALGFAGVENLLYTMTFGVRVAPVRALVSSLAHGAFSGLAGYYLGLARFNYGDVRWMVFRGLCIAALLHGLYNTLLMLKLISPVGIVIFLLIVYWLVFAALRKAVSLSPFCSS